MRIATWNLERPKERSWKKRPKIEAKIKEIGADIWVLTETHECIQPDRAVASVRSKLVQGLHQAGESRTTICSRWPVRRTLPTHDAERAVCIEVEAEGNAWLVYGTVIPYLRYGGDVHDQSIRDHVEEWTKLSNEFPNHRIVVAGDFNESLDTRPGRHHYGTTTGRKLLREGLAQAGLVCLTSRVEIEGKFGKRANIDHICVDVKTAADPQELVTWEPIAEDGTEMSDHIGLCIKSLRPST